MSQILVPFLAPDWQQILGAVQVYQKIAVKKQVIDLYKSVLTASVAISVIDISFAKLCDEALTRRTRRTIQPSESPGYCSCIWALPKPSALVNWFSGMVC